MASVIEIGDRKIGEKYPPFVVAELSANHDQSLEKAFSLVKAAAACGAHAVKLQTYTPDTMTLNIDQDEFRIQDKKSLWHNSTLYDLYQKAYTPWEWHAPIFKLANQLGVLAFSSPFDVTAVEFLEKLDVPCYKIASFENTDFELLKCVALTQKPVILSTGLATQMDLDQSIEHLRESGCSKIIILKCTSSYPASPSSANLKTIQHMRHRYQCPIGISDHTLGLGVSLASISFGAVMIEKHFTLDRSQGGLDAPFSMEPSELNQLVTESNAAWKAQGKVFYGPTKQETGSRLFRRSLYLTSDVKKGDMITKKNVRAIRPGMGLSPKYFEKVLGLFVTQKHKMGTPLSWDMLTDDSQEQKELK